MNTIKNASGVDNLLAHYGIKYMFVESGKVAVRDRFSCLGVLDDEGNPIPGVDLALDPDWNFWVELSWGSDGDDHDFAFNDFGTTFAEAFDNCIKTFEAESLRPGTKAYAFKNQPMTEKDAVIKYLEKSIAKNRFNDNIDSDRKRIINNVLAHVLLQIKRGEHLKE